MTRREGPQMTDRRQFRGDAAVVAAAASPWPRLRPWSPDDLDWHDDLSYRVFPHVGPLATREGSSDLTRSLFEGEWGEVVPDASPVALDEAGEPVGAILTVRRVAREGAPDCPFVLNVITEPEWRRRGVASGLMAAAAAVLLEAGETSLALSVDAVNAGAVALYLGLGFEDVTDRE